MMYLISFDKTIYTTPISVGQFLVMREDGDVFEQMTYSRLEVPIETDDVLEPALRGGFRHPDGLIVDESLVDIMTAPHRLEQASAAQLALEAQLDELQTGVMSPEEASHSHWQNQVARDARLDHEEALRWAATERKDLLDRPINEELQRHWEKR